MKIGQQVQTLRLVTLLWWSKDRRVAEQDCRYLASTTMGGNPLIKLTSCTSTTYTRLSSHRSTVERRGRLENPRGGTSSSLESAARLRVRVCRVRAVARSRDAPAHITETRGMLQLNPTVLECCNSRGNHCKIRNRYKNCVSV